MNIFGFITGPLLLHRVLKEGLLITNNIYHFYFYIFLSERFFCQSPSSYRIYFKPLDCAIMRTRPPVSQHPLTPVSQSWWGGKRVRDARRHWGMRLGKHYRASDVSSLPGWKVAARCHTCDSRGNGLLSSVLLLDRLTVQLSARLVSFPPLLGFEHTLTHTEERIILYKIKHNSKKCVSIFCVCVKR